MNEMGLGAPSASLRRRATAAAAAIAVLLGAPACDSEKSSPARPPGAPPKASASAAASASPAGGGASAARFPAAPRVVAIGDLHGDIEATHAALRLAGAIDSSDHWSGGALVLVQTGDELDRGDGERAIVELFDRLIEEAARAGGTVHALNGNHELMNVAGDFRYVTEGGYRDFANVAGASSLMNPRIASLPSEAQSRAAAFFPGGPYAKRLAKRNTIVIVGDTVFVHGGLLPSHVSYGVDRINREVSAWMNGDSRSPPAIAMAEDAPVWTRIYSEGAPGDRGCETLAKALADVGAKRMVVGHTVQKGINSACDGKVWRIDVGLSSFYGGPTEVLEIAGPDVRVIKKGVGAGASASASASAGASSVPAHAP